MSMIFNNLTEKVKDECIESVRKEVLFKRIERKWWQSKDVYRSVGTEDDLEKYTGYKPVKFCLIYRTVSGRSFTSEYDDFESFQDAFRRF